MTLLLFFFFQAEDGIRDKLVTGVQTCALPILWTAPVTNKILLEAGYSRLWYEHAGGPGQLPPDGIFDISAQEQSTAENPATGLAFAPRANYTYRALAQYSDNWSAPNHWRASDRKSTRLNSSH